MTDWVAFFFNYKEKKTDSSKMKIIIKHKMWNDVYYSLPMPVPEEKKFFIMHAMWHNNHYSYSSFHVMMGLLSCLKLNMNINPSSFRSFGQLQVTDFILNISVLP